MGNHVVGNLAGLEHGFRKGLFGQHVPVVHHVSGFDFHDQPVVVLCQDKEVRVVAPHAMRIRVNVVDVEIRLAVGQHPRKIDLLDGVLPDDVQEEILLRQGVKTVGIKVKALVGQGCARAVGVPFIEELRLCRVAAHLEEAFHRLIDEIDLHLFVLIVICYLIQGIK